MIETLSERGEDILYPTLTFYIASGIASLEAMKKMVVEIEQRTSWKCNSRWLLINAEHYSLEAYARMDAHDVSSASLLIITDAHSSLGGKWVELGLAVARGKPIFHVPLPSYMPGKRDEGPNIFLREYAILVPYPKLALAMTSLQSEIWNGSSRGQDPRWDEDRE